MSVRGPIPKIPKTPWSSLDSSYRFMKGSSSVIPSETRSGQLGMFPSTYGLPPKAKPGTIGRGLGGLISNQSPPFKVNVPKGAGTPREKARIARKMAVAKMKRPYGPMTETEFVDDLFGMRK